MLVGELFSVRRRGVFILYKLYKSLILGKTKKLFSESSEVPARLGLNTLESLQIKYPILTPFGYDAESLAQRGKKRAKEILSLIPANKEKIKMFLELGCFDGMVSCYLQRSGKETVAIDIITNGFDERALNEGVEFMQSDSTNFQFKDESFDFIFSYNSFEHFLEPELVLQEATRVVKKGGFIYLSFGPLFMSSLGLHIYRTITVPYCQFLFSKETLRDFVKIKEINAYPHIIKENNTEPFPFESNDWASRTPLNGWSVKEYRRLWSKYSHKLKKIRYIENLNLSNLDLIQKYPSCFKNKTQYFDNLIVSSITVLFQRIR